MRDASSIPPKRLCVSLPGTSGWLPGSVLVDWYVGVVSSGLFVSCFGSFQAVCGRLRLEFDGLNISWMNI